MTSEQHREKLLKDLNCAVNGTTIELPLEPILTNCFEDKDLEVWCIFNGVKFAYNHKPKKEFNCSTTILLDVYESPTVS